MRHKKNLPQAARSKDGGHVLVSTVVASFDSRSELQIEAYKQILGFVYTCSLRVIQQQAGLNLWLSQKSVSIIRFGQATGAISPEEFRLLLSR